MKNTRISLCTPLLFILVSCAANLPLSLPSGLPSNPSIRMGDEVVNLERQSWLVQPQGTTVNYSGHITIADIHKSAGLGSHEMRSGNVGLTLRRDSSFGLISQSGIVNGTPVSSISNTGGWHPGSGFWKEKIKTADSYLDSPFAWIPRGNTAWSNTFVESADNSKLAGEAGRNLISSGRYTISYQPKHSTIKTPAGAFLCDRICVHATETLEMRGPSKPGAVTQASYTPLKGEFFVSDQVPGLLVRHKFTTWQVNLIYLLLHKNSHINNGVKYPNAAVNAEKPQSYGYFELQSISRP